MLTTRRESNQGTELTVASALQGLTPDERADLHLAVFFTNVQPEQHPTWDRKWLREAVDAAYAYDVSPADRAFFAQLEADADFPRKGVLDYAYALDHGLQQGCDFVAILEDDILIAEGWLAHTLLGLQDVFSTLQKSPTDWLFMRLFNQERSTGWSSHHIGGHNEPMIVPGLAIGLVMVLSILRRRSSILKRHLDNATVLFISCICVPVAVVLFFQAGKASMLPPRPGVREEPFGCCSQFLVFPRAQVPGVINFLRTGQQGQVDLLLNGYSRANNLARLALYPVQLQHISRSSSRGTTATEAQAVWSMAFEGRDADRVHREHLRLASQLYGGSPARSENR